MASGLRAFHLPDGPEQRARDEAYATISASDDDPLARLDAVQGYDALTAPLD